MVASNLRRNIEYRRSTGCSKFTESVISEGYKPVLDGVPGKSREKNNASFRNNSEFGVEAVLKLLE